MQQLAAAFLQLRSLPEFPPPLAAGQLQWRPVDSRFPISYLESSHPHVATLYHLCTPLSPISAQAFPTFFLPSITPLGF